MTPSVVSPGRPPLLAAIRSEIAESGPMTFPRFMELALYHPQWGYYTAPDARTRIGRSGDFYTNVSVGALFGQLLSMQFAGMWEAMGKPASFTLLELGAHRGQLAADVRAWASRERPDFNAALDVAALDYPGGLPDAVTGCVFSNELLDALPVHLITRHAGEWLELFVAERDGRFAFAPAPYSCDALREEVSRLPLPAADGFVTEVHLEAGRWMERVAHSLRRGFVLTIDYGYSAEDYYAPHRKAGTLLCYHQQRSHNDPLVLIGEQDITAHVNFTALAGRGAACGLPQLGFCDQSRFVAGLLEKAGADFLARLAPKAAVQLKTLLHPELMGQTFKVLVQHRGMETARLSGLKFAR
ncbi:MAG: SAM-dependent methyltransferase [Verrucomicrobia bacterium]|nr:SAM-dependent methyltransferase [Verrucomicrobiota bacterium]